MNRQAAVEWSEMPLLLKVEEAASVLRIGRSKAYQMTTLYATSGGMDGLPVLRMGDLLRVPKFALHEFVTTGRVVQLVPANHNHAPVDPTSVLPRARTRRAADRAQLSLLGSD